MSWLASAAGAALGGLLGQRPQLGPQPTYPAGPYAAYPPQPNYPPPPPQQATNPAQQPTSSQPTATTLEGLGKLGAHAYDGVAQVGLGMLLMESILPILISFVWLVLTIWAFSSAGARASIEGVVVESKPCVETTSQMRDRDGNTSNMTSTSCAIRVEYRVPGELKPRYISGNLSYSKALDDSQTVTYRRSAPGDATVGGNWRSTVAKLMLLAWLLGVGYLVIKIFLVYRFKGLAALEGADDIYTRFKS